MTNGFCMASKLLGFKTAKSNLPGKPRLVQSGFVAQIVFAKDSLSESIVLAGGHEQLDTDDIQDPKLESV